MESKPSLSGIEAGKTREFNFPETSFERATTSIERETIQGSRSDVVPSVPIANVFADPSLPKPVQQVSPVVDDKPLIAGDDDLIEKEWVEKAKHIIASTKDDPYRREREVGQLQVDYLKKRYGRELGSSQ